MIRNAFYWRWGSHLSLTNVLYLQAPLPSRNEAARHQGDPWWCWWNLGECQAWLSHCQWCYRERWGVGWAHSYVPPQSLKAMMISLAERSSWRRIWIYIERLSSFYALFHSYALGEKWRYILCVVTWKYGLLDKKMVAQLLWILLHKKDLTRRWWHSCYESSYIRKNDIFG